MTEPDGNDAAVKDDPFALMLRAMALRAQKTAQVRALLTYGEAWIDVDGNRHLVAEMSPRYCATVVRWLELRAVTLHTGECDAMALMPVPNGEQSAFEFDDELYRLHSAQPSAWLDRQPLVRALRERAGATPAGPSRAWLARHPVIAVKVLARRAWRARVRVGAAG